MTAIKLRYGQTQGPLIIGAATNIAISGSGIALAWIFLAETTDAVTDIGFRYGARVGTPCAMVATIETVDATNGQPSGTDAGGGSPTAKIFTPPADTSWDGTWQYITLTNTVALTIGTAYAITIRYSSGTADSSTFTRSLDNRINTNAIPYSLTLSGGVWTKVTAVGYSYKTASKVYGYPGSGSYVTADSTAGHRICMFFTLPSGAGTSFVVDAVCGCIKLGAAAGSAKVGIWDAAGTELQATTLDSDNVVSVNSRLVFVPFASPATLSYGTKYYVGVEVVSGSCTSYGVTLGTAGDRDAFPLGTSAGLSTWNGSSWTDTTTVMPLIEMQTSDITVDVFINSRRNTLIGR